MSEGRVLLVEDKSSLRELLERVLQERFQVTTAKDGDEALRLLDEERFDVVVTDLRMPGTDGLSVLGYARAKDPGVEVILMTAHASVESAVEAMKLGAADYLQKPFEPDEALLRVGRAAAVRRLRDKAQHLEEKLQQKQLRETGAQPGRFGIVGHSEPMRQVFSLVEKAARLDVTVLVTGESGTGKELIARALHDHSDRKDRAFVAVNCGALPADLIESELFGHKKGAFTGANADHAGLVDAAGSGTLFLDEIGDLALPLQVKLNRLLQEREYRRVGDSKDRRFAGRVVAATHVDLAARVKDGRFREDLYWRLNVFRIDVPPVRDRSGDVPLLLDAVLAQVRARGGSCPAGFTPLAERRLSAWAWPGNVRELQNVVERAVAIAEGPLIDTVDLPTDLVAPPLSPGSDKAMLSLVRLPYRQAVQQLHDKATKSYLEALLRATDGNVSKAAEQADIARESLHRLLRKHDVDPDAYRS